MAHFAQLNEDNVVTQVIVVNNEDCGGGNFPESESIGQAFIHSIGLPGTWKQTSYNASFRKRFAGGGFFYDQEKDEFVAPQPFPSWTINDENEWVAPVPYPNDNKHLYIWNESSASWIISYEFDENKNQWISV